MSNVTQILSQIQQGDPSAADQLLPLVYDELRTLAAAKLANEKPGQTLQATALVHEAYLRLASRHGWKRCGLPILPPWWFKPMESLSCDRYSGLHERRHSNPIAGRTGRPVCR